MWLCLYRFIVQVGELNTFSLNLGTAEKGSVDQEMGCSVDLGCLLPYEPSRMTKALPVALPPLCLATERQCLSLLWPPPSLFYIVLPQQQQQHGYFLSYLNSLRSSGYPHYWRANWHRRKSVMVPAPPKSAQLKSPLMSS